MSRKKKEKNGRPKKEGTPPQINLARRGWVYDQSIIIMPPAWVLYFWGLLLLLLW